MSGFNVVRSYMRDKKIDLLRFIALSSLILAHIIDQNWIFQLNNFNVPLIVMASAMTMAHSPMVGGYFSYIRKRFKRLILPTWFFLIFYFILLHFTGIESQRLTFQHIWGNFTFSNNGGFMWIIRVFLLVSVCAPFISRFDSQITSNRSYLVILFAAFLIYQVFLLWLRTWTRGPVQWFVVEFGCYAISYGLIFALGMRLRKMSSKELWAVGCVSFLVFLVFCGQNYMQQGHFVQTQQYKYPPSAYYVSYALAASVVIFCLADYICKFLGRHLWLEGIAMFIAQNSLWIYFWHTIFLLVVLRFHYQGFLIKYFEVYFLSAFTVFVQVNIAKKWILPRIPDEKARKGINNLLTG